MRQFLSDIFSRRFYLGSTTGPFLSTGTGTPESVVTAPVGSMYLRDDGGTNTTIYRKEVGSGNTGWVAVSNAGGGGGPDIDLSALTPRLQDTADSFVVMKEGSPDTMGLLKALIRKELTVSTTTYTFVEDDAGRVVVGTNASAKTFTLPLNAALALPVGTMIIVRNEGAGLLTVTIGSGGTIDGVAQGTPTVSRGAEELFWKRATNDWTSVLISPAVVNNDNPGLAAAPEAGPSRYYAFHDMMSLTGGADFAFAANGTGAGSAQSSSLQDDGVGWVSFNLGTVATNRTAFTTALAASIRLGLGRAYYASRVRQVVLSDATNTYTERFGFIDSVTTESTDGVFFRYTHGTNTGKFQAVTRSNGTETAQDTGITAAINTTYKFEITVNAAGTSVEFRINGTLTNTITTNIPTASGRETGAGLMLLRSAGTTAVTPVAVDYVLVEQAMTAAR